MKIIRVQQSVCILAARRRGMLTTWRWSRWLTRSQYRMPRWSETHWLSSRSRNRPTTLIQIASPIATRTAIFIDRTFPTSVGSRSQTTRTRFVFAISIWIIETNYLADIRITGSIVLCCNQSKLYRTRAHQEMRYPNVMWHISYLFIYLPLNYDAPVLPEYFLSKAYPLHI